MRKINAFILLIALTISACKTGKYADLDDGIYADIQTNMGDIVLKLEHTKTPITVANFVSLAEGKSPFVSDEFKGKKYYDGLIFHRIMSDFMIQGGDPTGTGTGSQGYKFKDEFHDSLTHKSKGILSMANSGPKTNGSQFFITLKETPWLNGKHTVFGEVIIGMDVVDSLGVVKTGDRDKPISDVIMNKVEIIRKGKEAKKFDAIEIMTSYFAEEEETVKAFEKMKTDFISEIEKQKAEAEELPSGLKILKITDGEGPKPKMGQKVNVYYAGYLTNAEVFDSNIEAVAKKYNKYDARRKQGGGYAPLPMDYSQDSPLVPGFKEGLLSMKIGDKVRLFIPAHLGYGLAGSRNVIPPNADLIFDLEITGIAQ